MTSLNPPSNLSGAVPYDLSLKKHINDGSVTFGNGDDEKDSLMRLIYDWIKNDKVNREVYFY